MDKYPFIKCLHPRTIVNKNGEKITVPCGKCNACINHKCSHMSLLCKLEESEHQFCMFVTLTYSNDYIPVCSISRITNEYNEFLDYVDILDRNGCVVAEKQYLPISSEHLLCRKTNIGEHLLPYLDKTDCQKFIKRFRKNLTKYSNEKVRYYAVGEYGPIHFRPHFHLLFFYDKEETQAHFRECLRKSWKFGRVDASNSRHKSGSYVAGYVNSFVNLPSIYANSTFKPFQLHSCFFAQCLLQSKRQEIYETAPERFMHMCRNCFGSVVEFMPWRSLASYFFPRCKGYSLKSDDEKYYSYTILQRARLYYGKFAVSELARFICEDFYQGESNEVVSYFDLHRFDDKFSMYDSAFRAVYSELNLSKHFFEFCCDDASDYGSRVKSFKRILAFYRCRDYEQLYNFYCEQCDYAAEFGFDGLCYFYDNYSDDATFRVPCERLDDMPIYKNFRTESFNKFQKSIKHKKLNDLNNLFTNI